MRPIAANLLEAAEVRSPSGEDLGKIVDFMIDTERGTVEYAVLAVGGVLGVGAKMLAIPPESLALDGSGARIELSVDTGELAAAPGIDRANMPPTAESARGGKARPATRLRGS
jgi:sporulation protein YlmC with PRC-barrel domain